MVTPSLSHQHISLILNGTRVTGFADDDQPVEFDPIELVQERWGDDGTLYLRGTARRGTMMTVKLLPTSPQVSIWLREFARIQRGEAVGFAGSYGDISRNFATLLRGGALKRVPPAVTPGGNMEFQFVFEETVPEHDNTDFGAESGIDPI